MSLPIVLRDEAQAEFDEAFDFYETRTPGLGAGFVARVQQTFDHIAANPRRYVVVFADIHKALVKRFLYCVDYRAEAARVEVIAVFHTARDPSIWRGRA